MEPNKELIFEVMVMFPDLLEDVIRNFNINHNSDFQIFEIIEEIEIVFCKIKVTQYEVSDIFSLGYSLATNQYILKNSGKLDW